MKRRLAAFLLVALISATISMGIGQAQEAPRPCPTPCGHSRSFLRAKRAR